MCAVACGGNSQSACSATTQFAVAARAPAAICRPRPHSDGMIRSGKWVAAATDRVASVDPPSTTMTSATGTVCAEILASACGKSSAAFKVGITTATLILLSFPPLGSGWPRLRRRACSIRHTVLPPLRSGWPERPSARAPQLVNAGHRKRAPEKELLPGQEAPLRVAPDKKVTPDRHLEGEPGQRRSQRDEGQQPGQIPEVQRRREQHECAENPADMRIQASSLTPTTNARGG